VYLVARGTVGAGVEVGGDSSSSSSNSCSKAAAAAVIAAVLVAVAAERQQQLQLQQSSSSRCSSSNSAFSGVQHMSEALRIFKRTVGDDSPLTAHAMGSLGKLRAVQGPGKQREALSLLKGALALEVHKDAFHLETVWELLTRLKDLHMEEAKERHSRLPASQHGSHLAALNATYSQYLPLVEYARGRITPQHEKDDIGTLAVFYKTAGELCMLAQEYQQGEARPHTASLHHATHTRTHARNQARANQSDSKAFFPPSPLSSACRSLAHKS